MLFEFFFIFSKFQTKISSPKKRRDRDRDRGRDRDRDRSRRDDRDRRDRSRRRDSPIRRKSLTPPSLVPRAKTPPEGGTGGFFVRGGVQKSTMKKSDNVDDHVFMPGDKIGEAFLTENAEKPKKTKDDKDKEKVFSLLFSFEN